MCLIISTIHDKSCSVELTLGFRVLAKHLPPITVTIRYPNVKLLDVFSYLSSNSICFSMQETFKLVNNTIVRGMFVRAIVLCKLIVLELRISTSGGSENFICYFFYFRSRWIVVITSSLNAQMSDSDSVCAVITILF